MKCRPTSCPSSTAKRAHAGFTLAEVLAALLFLAIVIPVAVQGLQVASRAGQVAVRKAAAVRVADRLLNEAVVIAQWRQGIQSGVYEEGPYRYRWSLQLEPWDEGVLHLLTIQVLFPIQDRDYEVHLSTLVDTAIQ